MQMIKDFVVAVKKCVMDVVSTIFMLIVAALVVFTTVHFAVPYFEGCYAGAELASIAGYIRECSLPSGM